ncbi:MAG TPA: hypothetical protein VFY29_02465 [Terriglobia bacterium]|nr:hypothetical protein [Terriglobia bacterium]
MKKRILLVFSVCLAVFAAAEAEDTKKEEGLAGKWITDAVSTAIPDVKSKSVLGRVLDSVGDVATQQVTAPRGPGGRIGGRGPQVDTSPATVVEKGNSPDGAALILELKPQKSRLTGKVTEVVKGDSFDIEEGKVTGATFEFVTYKKVLNAKTPTTYKGELRDDETIILTRLLPSGKEIDPEPLIFKRVK